jgi:uncharacterized protein YcbK (DUF882 family)
VIDRRKLFNLGLGAGLSLAGPLAAAAAVHRSRSHLHPGGRHTGLHHAGMHHGEHAGGRHHSRRSLFSMETHEPLRVEPAAVEPQTIDALLEPRVITLKNLHTDEALDAVYWDEGGYVPDALEAVNNILRDYRTGDVHPINPRLLDVLTDLRAGLGSKAPLQVISGYRSPQTNAMLRERSAEVAQHSFHMDGMAIDIYLDDVELDRLRMAALSLGRGGVGYYPMSRFVHVDVGPVRQWEGA